MRIAISISGEPRIFEEKCAESFRGFCETLESQDWVDEVHVYGHTWDHCKDQILKSTQNKLYNFNSSPIEEITEWVKQDLNRLHNPLDKSIIALDNIENLLEYSTTYWAQHYGFIRGLDHVSNGYDYVIRWRWDNTVLEDPQVICNNIKSCLIEQPIKKDSSIIFFCKHSVVKINSSDKDVISPVDHYFIMSRKFVENFKERFWNGGNKKYFVYFEMLIQNLTKDLPPPRDHFLWHEMLRIKAPDDTIFSFSLNEGITMDRDRGWNTDDMKKSREQKVMDWYENNKRN